MKIIVPLVILSLVSGCTTGGRIVGDIVGGASGGYIAHRLSGGDPLLTSAGAAAGVAASEVISWATTKARQRAYTTGYNQARADLAREQFRRIRELHRPIPQLEGETYLYPIPIPETQIDGATIEPTVRYLRIQQ